MGATLIVPENISDLQAKNHEHDKGSSPVPGNKTFDYYMKKGHNPEDLKDPNSNGWGGIADSLASFTGADFKTRDGFTVKGSINPEEKGRILEIQNNKNLSNFEAAGQLLEIYHRALQRITVESIQSQENGAKKDDKTSAEELLKQI